MKTERVQTYINYTTVFSIIIMVIGYLNTWQNDCCSLETSIINIAITCLVILVIYVIASLTRYKFCK